MQALQIGHNIFIADKLKITKYRNEMVTNHLINCLPHQTVHLRNCDKVNQCQLHHHVFLKGLWITF